MSVVSNNLLLAAEDGGYVIDRSLRFRSSASAFLNRTPASAGNRRTWTWSGWVKRGALGSSLAIFSSALSTSGGEPTQDRTFFSTSNTLNFDGYVNNATIFNLVTTQVFRDPSAWYHLVFQVDTTQATASNRIRIYVNGAQVTAFNTATYPAQNTQLNINNNILTLIGRTPDFFSDQYLTEINFIDGQALTPSSFGETNALTGVWQPKKYTGTYGTNGFYLDFKDPTSTTTLTADKSGRGNNWTANNISLTSGVTYDSMIDTPTPVADERGNFAVMNPLETGAGPFISAGNLTLTSNDSNYRSCVSTIAVTSGKWYMEAFIGLRNFDTAVAISNLTTNVSYYYLANNGNKWDTSTSSVAYGASYTSGDLIGIAFDADARSITFYKNGVSQGVAFSSMPVGNYVFHSYSAGSGANLAWNFGQRPFAYTPPSGFKALHTGNLPEPAIVDGRKQFDAVTYTGNGVNGRTVGGFSFQPGFLWNKRRSNVASNHLLVDEVRGSGTGVMRTLFSSKTDAEETTNSGLELQFGAIGALTSNGFTAVSGTFASNPLAGINASNESYVAWGWKANGAGVTNTAGSITSTVSANPTAGFSIVTATAQSSGAGTVGHGLGVAPSMVIIKGRGAVTSWGVYHIRTSAGGYTLLNSTAAYTADINFMNSTAPSSTVFTLGSSYAGYGTFVAYCFAEVPGYSRFGSYTGNGSADGPFVFCGFRPRFVLIKRTDSTADWQLYDTARGVTNVITTTLAANLSSAEGAFVSGYDIDLLSNGFKPRAGPSNAINASGGSYIYMAFAEVPFKAALAR